MTDADHVFGTTEIYMSKLQAKVSEWQRRNFPVPEADKDLPEEVLRRLLSAQLLQGVTEELGELAHAHLKADQGIRTDEDHEAGRVDAVGDLVIYLMNYCEVQGIQLHKCVLAAWESIKDRDWVAYPETGLPKDA